MGLQVIFKDQVLFDAGDGGNVLVPFDEAERAKVFYALTGALTVLSGVKPLSPSDATATETDARYGGSGRYQSDRTGGVVVPLRARQADRDVPTKR